jgi:hypothetical protein
MAGRIADHDSRTPHPVQFPRARSKTQTDLAVGYSLSL